MARSRTAEVEEPPPTCVGHRDCVRRERPAVSVCGEVRDGPSRRVGKKKRPAALGRRAGANKKWAKTAQSRQPFGFLWSVVVFNLQTDLTHGKKNLGEGRRGVHQRSGAVGCSPAAPPVDPRLSGGEDDACKLHIVGPVIL